MKTETKEPSKTILKEANKEIKKEHKPSREEVNKEKLDKVKQEESDIMRSFLSGSDWSKRIKSTAYYEGENYLKMVCKKISYGMIWEGAGGLGKTFTTLKVFNENCKDDFILINSFSTPAAIYICLYENRDKHIIFDDTAGLLTNTRALSYLKAATWTTGSKERLITNLSSKQLKNSNGEYVPNFYFFNGTITLLTNSINKKNVDVLALLSRVLHCKIELDFKERMRIIKEITKEPYGDLTDSEREEIYKFIEQHTSEANIDLNFRTLIKIYQFFQLSKISNDMSIWQRLGLKLLEKDDIILLVEELEKSKDFPRRKDKVERFVEITGKSEATYYRYYEKLAKNSQTFTPPKNESKKEVKK